MTVFLRLLDDKTKSESLRSACNAFRAGQTVQCVFDVDASILSLIPGQPFAYWVSRDVIKLFESGARLQSQGRTAVRTNGTTDDGRWLRTFWECERASASKQIRWVPHAKGGAFSPFYSDLHLVIAWSDRETAYPGYQGTEHRPDVRPASAQYFFRPGLTWSRRTQGGLSFRALPRNCIFGDKGPAIFVEGDDTATLLALLAVVNSAAFSQLVSLQVAFGSYEAGVIQKTPVPSMTPRQKQALSDLARKSWSLKRNLESVQETSHAFALPAALRDRLSQFDPRTIELELARIKDEVDTIAFELYAFSDSDRAAALGGRELASDGNPDAGADDEGREIDEEDNADPIAHIDGLLSWAVGVTFGRFDIRLATCERAAPPESEPFDPMPAKSPGMLSDGDSPFHAHAGILVDDPGHAHDLVRIAERVLERVGMPVPADLRRWMQKDFFPFHLQRYSKSRRKAPIYWPLATISGSYTLWLYYPSLTSQTLYSAINDFVEPKLADVEKEVAALRAKGSARSRDEEKRLEALATLEAELINLRDLLHAIAPHYQPNHDDGVQITAAPLWPLFRHKPWQKLLKDTWAKLQKGDYDWAHLAMNYWPERVREKCKTDKSLAIAHGLEDLYVEPEAAPKKARGRKKKEDAE